MRPLPMRHLVVVVPGIGGSVLHRGGHRIWGSLGDVLRLGVAPGVASASLSLRPPGDAGATPEPVSAVALIDDMTVLPGIAALNGYDRTTGWLARHFSAGIDPEVAVRTMPYDWRSDNRLVAAALRDNLDLWLDEFRRASGNARARAVVLAHSMGGLVARYAVEVLGGWRDVAALVTLGTPHRGAPKALNVLANGVPMIPVVAELVRGYPSVYQLLPTYRCIERGGELVRVGELSGADLGHGIDEDLVRDGAAFHAEIDAAARVNAGDPDYARRHHLIPVVGTEQTKTIQSFRLGPDGLRPSRTLPDALELPRRLSDGDGTVPRLAAMPRDSPPSRPLYAIGTHSALQLPALLTARLFDPLMAIGLDGQTELRGPGVGDAAADVGIEVDVEDARVGGPRPHLSARLIGCRTMPSELKATVTASTGARTEVELVPIGPDHPGRYQAASITLPAGVYAVEVSAPGAGPVPDAASDVFCVLAGEGDQR